MLRQAPELRVTSLCRLAVAALLYPCGPMTPASAQQPDTAGALPAPNRYEPVLDQFRRMTARGDSVALVRNLSLQRDAIRFQLEDGTLYLATPVEGRTIAAIFIGQGTVAFTPPLEIERGEVRRILGDSVVNSRISAAAFVFTDSTLSELRRQAGFHAGGDAGRAAGVLHDALDRLVDGQDLLQPTLIAILRNGDGARDARLPAVGLAGRYGARRGGGPADVLPDQEEPGPVDPVRRARARRRSPLGARGVPRRSHRVHVDRAGDHAMVAGVGTRSGTDGARQVVLREEFLQLVPALRPGARRRGPDLPHAAALPAGQHRPAS